MNRILLADSDADQLEVIAYLLRRKGFRVSIALDGRSAMAKWQSEEPDLIILETALPKISGLEVCRQIRDSSQVPLIFTSDKSQDEDVVAAFDAGADDYVVKPFSTRQLLARVGAAVRRSAKGLPNGNGSDSTVTAGNMVINSDERSVTVGGKKVRMTPIEFRLLYCLARNKERLVSSDKLVDYIWGFRDGGGARVLATHISHIRRKLLAADPSCNNIKCVSGIGYRLED